MDLFLNQQTPPNEPPSSAEEQLQRLEPSLLKTMTPCQHPSVRGVLKRGLPSRDKQGGKPPSKKTRTTGSSTDNDGPTALAKKNVSITLPPPPHCTQKTPCKSLNFFRKNNHSREERRLEIAFMLDRATRFANDVEKSGHFRHCASSPNMGYEQQQQQQQQQQHLPQRRQQRYNRRNSFVIHRGSNNNKVMSSSAFSPPDCSSKANATFSLPPPPAAKKKTMWPLGLRKQESHLVLGRISPETSTESDTKESDED